MQHFQVEDFLENDEGYYGWLEAHPQGFVLNCDRNPKPTALSLHSATCFYITKYSRLTSTCRGNRKICSDSKQDLLAWAEKRSAEA